ncbi:MAG: hypothetical protein NTX03_13765 [Bacteroidetes bacterium]|nr:hypothetical protein [Bacteroidota bacterium]
MAASFMVALAVWQAFPHFTKPKNLTGFLRPKDTFLKQPYGAVLVFFTSLTGLDFVLLKPYRVSAFVFMPALRGVLFFFVKDKLTGLLPFNFKKKPYGASFCFVLKTLRGF